MSGRGNLFIVSGPSGSGKSVIVAAVIQTLGHVRFSVSFTTRPPRGGERDGIDYRFISGEEFAGLVASEGLLEWAHVHGNHYGTSREFVDRALAAGEDVLLDIDVQGARQVRAKVPEVIGIFIMPPAFGALRARLENRRLDDHQAIERRLQKASEEILQYEDYDYLIVNDDLARSVEELKAVILAARCKMPRRAGLAKSVLETFGGMNAEGS